MALFCPIFPKSRLADYEDINDIAFSRVVPKRGANRALAKQRSKHSRLYSSAHNLSDAAQHSQSFVRTVCASEVAQFKPYCRGRVNTSFEPTVDDEIGVQRGDMLRALYKEDDWLYVVTQHQTQGFMPAMYCQLYVDSDDNDSSIPSPHASLAVRRDKKRRSLRLTFVHKLNKYMSKSQDLKTEYQTTPPTTAKDYNFSGANGVAAERGSPLPADSNESSKAAPPTSPKAVENVQAFLESLRASCNDDECHSSVPSDPRNNDSPSSSHQPTPNEGVSEFISSPLGTCCMAYAFVAREPDDLSVGQGQPVTLLNADDPQWYWASDANGNTGFVPAAYLDISTYKRAINGPAERPTPQPAVAGSNEPTELLVTHDVQAQCAHDLTLRTNDWVYTTQPVEQQPWLWVLCPRLGRSGFVPSSAVHKPLSTVL